MSAKDASSCPSPIGLFPLPNVVLFPHATIPLQVFEPRYRAMIRDALETHRLIAMAFLRPGYEGYYHTNLADVSPIVCVGKIREHVLVPDGRYFINLQGQCRARIRSEDRDGEYRLAQLDRIAPNQNPLAQGYERDVRNAMSQALASPILAELENIDKCRTLLDRPGPLEELIDFIAAALLPPDAVEIKQRLLEEPDLLQRAAILVADLRRMEQLLQKRQRTTNEWPRNGSTN